MSTTIRNRFTGILSGWDASIIEHYQLKHSVTTITAARDAYQKEPDLPALFGELFGKIEANMNSDPKASIGTSNWELRPALEIIDHNESLEKRLEKRIVHLAEEPRKGSPLSGWYNQIPAASGYASPTSNRKNSIDLVYEIECSKEYEIIELKVDNKSGTPFYAAYENLSYGFLYLLTRTHNRLRQIFAEALVKPILAAKKVQLVILAPDSYFDANRKFSFELKRFEETFDAALRDFAKSKVPGLEMGFEFRQFSNPVSSREKVESFKGFEPGPCGERVPFQA